MSEAVCLLNSPLLERSDDLSIYNTVCRQRLKFIKGKKSDMEILAYLRFDIILLRTGNKEYITYSIKTGRNN